jgi:Tetratricopeptide repeat
VKTRGRPAFWAGKGARIWARHWVLIAGSFLVFVSVLLKWVEFPFSRNRSGLQLPLLQNVAIIPHIHLFSFGVIGIGVLIGGIVLLRLSRSLLVLAAAVLLTLCVLAPCQIAFQQPALLRRLTDEAGQVTLIRSFTKKYLPQNYGTVDETPNNLDVATPWGRLAAASSFLGLGWYCFGLGAILIAVYSVGRLAGTRGGIAMALICLPVGALVLLSSRPLIAQHFFTRARKAQAQGHIEKAIADYQKTMRWDRWHEQGVDIYATIGELQRQSGMAEDSPERHINKAQQLKEAGQYEEAIFEFNRAADAGGELAAAARRESARTHVDLGLVLYSGGGIGAAVTNWQQALAEDPLRLYVLPYLARGNYDLGRYQAALATVDRMVRIGGDVSMLADAYSLGGDCYAKLGQDEDARRYYNSSLKLDAVINNWAATGLIGE